MHAVVACLRCQAPRPPLLAKHGVPGYRTESGHCLIWDLRKPDHPAAMLQVDSEPIFGLDLQHVSRKPKPETPAAEVHAAQLVPSSRDDDTIPESSAAAAPANALASGLTGTGGPLAGTAHGSLSAKALQLVGRGPHHALSGSVQESERYAHKGLSIIAGGAANELFWLDGDISAGTLARRRTCKLPEPGIADVCVRGDGRIVAAGAWDGSVRVYHAARCKPLAVLKRHSAAVAAVAFDNTTQQLASGGRDGLIALWDVFRDVG